MASIKYRTIHLAWREEEYSVNVTFDLITKIDDKYSISRLAKRLMDGDTPVSHVAAVVGIMLRHAGCKVKDEEVYMELVAGDTSAVYDMAVKLINAAVVPGAEFDEGNEPAPAKKPSKRNTKK